MTTKKGLPQGIADVCSTKSGTGTVAAAAAIAGMGARQIAFCMNGLICGPRPGHREHWPAVREVSGNLMTDTPFMAFGAQVIDRSALRQVIERVGFGARGW